MQREGIVALANQQGGGERHGSRWTCGAVRQVGSQQGVGQAYLRGVVERNGNVESVDEMVSPDFIGHLDGGKTRDIETLRHDIRMYQGGLGELHEVIEDLIAEGDKVVGRYTLYGTHTGDFLGVKPSGRKVKVSGIEIFRIVDGKIAEFWHFGETIDLT